MRYLVRYEEDSCIVKNIEVEASSMELAGDHVRYSSDNNIEILSVSEIADQND